MGLEGYERVTFAQMLARTTPEEVEAFRVEVNKAQEEEERKRNASRMSDPVGTVRISEISGERTLLVRYNPNEDFPDECQDLLWHVFWDYRSESLTDYEIKQDTLSEPVFQLTREQMNQLGLT